MAASGPGLTNALWFFFPCVFYLKKVSLTFCSLIIPKNDRFHRNELKELKLCFLCIPGESTCNCRVKDIVYKIFDLLLLWKLPLCSSQYFWIIIFQSSHRGWPTTLLKKRLWHRCFPVNFLKVLRKPFLQNTSRWLFLYNANHQF